MAFDGTYLKVYELASVYFQYDVAGTITEVAFPWANAIKPSQETETFSWRGSGARKDVTVLTAINWTLDLDAIPLAAHASLFGKSEITAADVSPADLSTMVGFGGGNDRGGVTRGIRATAHAYAGALDTAVNVGMWIPVATITLSGLSGFNAGAVADKFQYSISATLTAVDITNGAITGASSGGEYVFFYEET